MTDDLSARIEELLAENQRLRQELELKGALAARALASFQQRRC